VGSTVTQTLDDTGVSSAVSNVVSTAAEKTKAVGSTIYETGSHIVDAGAHKIEEAK
jgi:hypothetical protein